MDNEQKKILLHKNSSPMLVSGSQNETEEMRDMQWVKFDALPESVKEKLSSQETIRIIQNIGEKNNLSLENIADISRVVRMYYFREIQKEGFEDYLVKRLPQLNKQQITTIVKIIVFDIIQKNNISSDKIIKMTLNTAIAKYPQILQQKITGQSIISKPFLKPLKPTVKNWIIVYEKVLDVSKHSVIERGEFVYRAEATKGLTEEERKKLSILFKSRDEDSELMIDENQKEIIFHVPQIKKQTTILPPKAISQNIPQKNNSNFQKKPPINQMGNVHEERKKTFDFIMPIKSVSMGEIDEKENQKKDVKLEEKKQEKKGFFGTQSYLPQKDSELENKNNTNINTVTTQKIEEKKQENTTETNQQNPIQKEQALQAATGEIEFFAKNITQRPQINNQNSHSTKNGERRVVGSADFEVQDIEMSDGVAQKKKQRDVENMITREKEELQKATQKVETLINSMQDDVQIPRDIGEPVKEKGQYKPHKEGGNLKEEIKKNQKDLYGITFSEEDDNFDVDIAEKKSVSNAKSLEEKIVFENDAGSKIKDGGDVNMLKKEKGGGEIVFSSNHTLPSERDGEKKKDAVKNLFSISPMGQSHVQKTKNQKQKNKKDAE